MKQKSFYCYLDTDQKPVISEKRPDNFEKLAMPYKANCPSLEIAKLVYQTKCKIENWRQTR